MSDVYIGAYPKINGLLNLKIICSTSSVESPKNEVSRQSVGQRGDRKREGVSSRNAQASSSSGNCRNTFCREGLSEVNRKVRELDVGGDECE